MKEAIIVGMITGALAMAGFAAGHYLGEQNAVVHVCKDGQLYAGYVVDGEQQVAQVIYPIVKARCNNA